MPPPRKIVVHYHLFKNAGTSIERALRQLFGDALYQLESETPGGVVHARDAETFIESHDNLQALTSHQLRPPLPQGDYSVFPILLVREPLVRARSAYLFEWQKQLRLSEPKGSFAEYVSEKLAKPGSSVIANYQTTHISRYLPGSENKTPFQHVDMALAVLNDMPGFGLVELYNDSLEMINHGLESFMGSTAFQLESRHDNVTQDGAGAVEETHALMIDELGQELFDELAQRNHLDSLLYRQAAELFDNRFTQFTTRNDPDRPRTRSTNNAVDNGSQRDDSLRRLARRVRWQDRVLGDIENIRRSESERLRETEEKLAEAEGELNRARSLQFIEKPEAAPVTTPTSRLRPIQGRLQRKPLQASTVVDMPDQTFHLLIADSGLFDPDAYLASNPDVAVSGVNPLDHYLQSGGSEGRAASSRFDSQAYLDASPDVVAAGMNPLVHYLLHGRQEGRPAVGTDGDAVLTVAQDIPNNRPKPDEFRSICRRLSFPTHLEVDASIVIPVYNQIDYTIACIESLTHLDTRYRFEVIVMDDCSTDKNAAVLDGIEGLRYVRNDTNLGFLRTCNRSGDYARGDYLVLLNSDTSVDARWLDELLNTFRTNENVGLVGSKLIYPGGHLQEAGGVIFQDASGWNYGKNQPADHPRYNHLRDVDYCSAASIAIERSYFDQLGRFDEQFAPAYYEDTDLSFKVRHDGKRVVYQPASIATHHEGISCGTDVTSGVKKHQALNQDRFLAKWRDELSQNHFPGSLSLPEAADRLATGHVLIVDAQVPTPDRDSGSIDMFNMIRILTAEGFRVHFVPAHDFASSGKDVEALQQLGVSVAVEPHYASLDAYLQDHNDRFDTVILSRVTVAKDAIDKVLAACPSARTVFYTVDLHFLRLQREAQLRNDRELQQQADQFEAAELRVMDLVDTTIVLSQVEKDLLTKMGRHNIEIIPLIRETSDQPIAGFDDRDGVVFVGGFRHPPNVDAVTWLLDDIWPEVRRTCARRCLPPITLRIIGGNLPDHLRIDADDIEVYGYVENLEPIFRRTLLSVAPLRYGAGLKGKVATSLNAGLPVVATSAAVEGVPNTEAIVATGDSKEEIAANIMELATDRSAWQHRSAHARQFVEENYAIDVIRPLIMQLMLGRPAHSDYANLS